MFLLPALFVAAFQAEGELNCGKIMSSDVTEYRNCDTAFENAVSDGVEYNPGDTTAPVDVSIINCKFTGYNNQGTSTAARAGICYMNGGKLVVNGSQFIECSGMQVMCFWIESSASAELEECVFRNCSSSHESGSFFPGESFGGHDPVYGCIGGKGPMSMTGVQFIENNDGALTFYKTNVDLRSCIFKENRPYRWQIGWGSIPKGGDIAMGQDAILTAENCIFSNTYDVVEFVDQNRRDGRSLRCYGKSVSFTNCYFETESTDGATMAFFHWSNYENTEKLHDLSVTLSRCSFKGPCLHLKNSTLKSAGKLSITVVIQECVSFSGENKEAVASDVDFDEDLVLYNGGACFWWPSSEEEGGGEEEMSPSPSDAEEGEVDTGASESEVNPGVDEDSETSSSLKDDVIPGEDNDGKSPPKKGLSDGEIAAAVVVPLAVVIGVAVLIVFFLWRRKRMEDTSLSPQGTVETAQETGSSGI